MGITSLRIYKLMVKHVSDINKMANDLDQETINKEAVKKEVIKKCQALIKAMEDK